MSLLEENDTFIPQCDKLREFLVLHERIPKRVMKPITEHDMNENSLSIFVQGQRTLMRNGRLSDERKVILDRINVGLLEYKLHYHSINCQCPNKFKLLWDKVFDEMAAKTTMDEVRKERYSSTNKPYVSGSARSLDEYMVIKTQCHYSMSPRECNPSAPPGTMQNVLSYAVNPDTRPQPAKYGLRSTSNRYEKNVADEDPPFHHSRSGTLIHGKNQSSEYLSLLQKTTETLFPNHLLERMRQCETLEDFNILEKENLSLFDTFHYGLGGQGKLPLVQIMQTRYPQPRRTGFSCTIDGPHLFPHLGVPCVKLYSYGASGRAPVDGRCRPMGKDLYNLGVATWGKSYEHLSPMNQIHPPPSAQNHLYVQINEDQCSAIRRKYDSELESLEFVYSGSLSKKKVKVHRRSKINNEKLETLYSGRVIKTKYENEMRIHHDNGYVDHEQERLVGANHDRDMNSHVFGSCVMTVNVGDPMKYYLVKPDYSKGEDYRLSAKKARLHLSDYKNNNQLDLVKTITFDHGSIYIHPAHDDEMYHHGAEFEKAVSSQNKVRLAIIYRHLSVPTYFRNDPNDGDCNRYSMVNKHAFEAIEGYEKGSSDWWNALGYNNGDCIKSLMDPF